MKIPLCNFCVKSGILCQRCLEKVRKGEVKETAIAVAQLLLKLEGEYSVLQKITFYNAYQVENVLAIIVGGGEPHHLLSGGGRILRAIAKNTGKKVKVFEMKGDARTFFEALFAPVLVTSINKIWLPDGTTETRVVLSGRYRRLPLKMSVIKELAKKIRGVTLRVDFEYHPRRNF